MPSHDELLPAGYQDYTLQRSYLEQEGDKLVRVEVRRPPHAISGPSIKVRFPVPEGRPAKFKGEQREPLTKPRY